MIEILVILVCLLINALLAGLEIGFVSASKPHLRHLSKLGSKVAKRILELRDNPERTLSIIQIGITLVGAVAAAVGGAGASEWLSPLLMARFGLTEGVADTFSILFAVIPITYLSVVFGELVPKTLALRNPVLVSIKGAPWLLAADRLLAPAVDVLESSTKWVVKVFFKRSKTESSVPESIVELDSLAQHHQEAVLNLAHLEKQSVKEILVPWENVNCVKSTDTIEDIIAVVFASGHTRLPVIHEGTVIGILHTKEFLAYRENGGKDWKSIIRPVLRIHASDTALGTMRLMQARRSHMAAVFSPQGERLGIVTLEDILEEFLGDVYDEDDQSFHRKVFADRVKAKLLAKRGQA